MTLLTSEQSGIISALLLIHIICLRFGVPTRKNKINVWVDNEEALRKIATTNSDDIRLKAYGSSEKVIYSLLVDNCITNYFIVFFLLFDLFWII